MNAKRCFTAEDQMLFARLSGDCNPMHLDPVAARRTQAGAPVVHGVHALLWMLETIAADDAALNGVNNIRVQFTKFAHLGRQFELKEGRATGGSRRFTLVDDGVTLVTLTLSYGLRHDRNGPTDHPAVAWLARPNDLTMSEMDRRAGWITPDQSADQFLTHFPKASRAFDPARLQALAQLSYLVGMVCPGLHSIFAKLELDVLATIPDRAGIGFSAELDDRFRLVNLSVHGSGIAGQVAAYARHPPVEPKSMAEIAQRVGPDEFRGVVALVVGGSRGMGATTAKVVAAGGGRVIITYANARAEADRIALEIEEAGRGGCEILHLDVFDDDQLDLSGLKETVTALYYFATPPIFSQHAETFSTDSFLRFSHVYVVAFAAICGSLLSDKDLAVLYPSSTAVERRPRGMTEYSMAKAAGEILCADLAASHKSLHIRVERLPRVLTDQTATVMNVDAADAFSVMLPIVREMSSQPRK